MTLTVLEPATERVLAELPRAGADEADAAVGRFAEPREIAAAALFLASDESSYVNASTFLVDGGLSGAYVTPE